MYQLTPKLGTLLLCLLLPFFPYAQQTCGIYSRPDNPDPSEIDGEVYYDRFGNVYSEKDLIVRQDNPNKLLTGNFELNFGTGFTPSETETICAVFQYLSTIVGLAPGAQVPIINVQKDALNPGVLGTASPYFTSRGCGYSNNTIFNLMMGGTDQGLSPSIQAGFLKISETHTFHTIDNDPIPANGIDLYSVALHEALHIIGFSSRIASDGTPINSAYSRWDEFLFNTDINDHLILDQSGFGSCCSYADFNDLLTFPDDVDDGCANNIYFRASGTNIARVNANYGSAPLTNAVVANILSHIDRCGDPGDDYVMTGSIGPGITRRILTGEEESIIYALGYFKPDSSPDECLLIAVKDFLPIDGTTEIPFADFLENDIYPTGTTVNITSLGSIFSEADVTVNTNSILIENAPYGIFTIYYSLEGCNGECYRVISNLYHFPVLDECPTCDPTNLFCHGSFDDILPNTAYGIEPALGLPFCGADGGTQSSADVVILQQGGNAVLLGGGTEPSSFLERMYIPLTDPAMPGCKMEVCFDIASFNCSDNLGVDIYGTNTPNCSGLWESDCNSSAPYYCVASPEGPDCTFGNFGISIDCNHPAWPSEYTCDPGVTVKYIDEEVDFKSTCVEIANETLTPWNYLVISRQPIESYGYVLVDNVTVAGDCCEEDPCGAEVIETCKENSVTLTVLKDGVPIPMYNADCCVTWSGIAGIPTIECPPQPGLPSQNFNNIGVPYGQKYCVEITCEDDCHYIYCGTAGELCEEGGESKAAPLSDNRPTSVIRLAPNPASDQLELFGESLKTGQSWIIYNAAGQIQLSGQIQSTPVQQIEIDKLQAGLYYLRLQSPDGTMITAKRFIKH
ncbi:MAG: T9SS type A sorting domain-containing protein [Bacteroidetes bacterium]|nr:T9SS type A sorting domain-containing protein [Bacteroidota bacterium]